MINRLTLKALRVSAGLTQTQLAERLGNGGYSKCIVSAIENGKRNVGLNLLNDWAAACGYRINVQFEKINQ